MLAKVNSCAVVGTMKYYPYGAARTSTGSMVTDKLFTGQQKESLVPDTLGLYDYGARFYSTLTGRFLSPDPLIGTPGDPQMLNRYSYVRNNPLIFVDPTGLQIMLVCGLGQNCEGGEVGGYEEWVIQYWMEEEGISEDEATARWEFIMGEKRTASEIRELFWKYGVLFVNTEKQGINIANFWRIKQMLEGRYAVYVMNVELQLGKAERWDVVLGFSLGGKVVHDILSLWGKDFPADLVILIQAAFQLEGYGTYVNAASPRFENTRIITLNDPRSFISGRITNAINIDAQPGGDFPLFHYEMGQLAEVVMPLAYNLPPGVNSFDQVVVQALNNTFRNDYGGFHACIYEGPEGVRC